MDISDIAARLNGSIEALARQLAPAGRREGHEWVALNPTRADKNPGSFRICIGGAKCGIWSEFAEGIGGDALDLVAYIQFAGDKKQAVAWARDWLGVNGDRGPPVVQDKSGPDKYRKMARAIFLGAQVSVKGTPVEAYLLGRGIDLDALGRQPGALRYAPECYCTEIKRPLPAMLWAITGADGSIASIHRTYLQIAAGGTVIKADLRDAKKTLGGYRGGFIRVWRGASGKPLAQAAAGETVVVTEGIEDGLTVAVAAPEHRIGCAVSLANMKNILWPDNISTVMICGDNDGDGSPAVRALGRAVVAFQAQGKKVLVARSPIGKDMNDILTQGVG